MHGSLYSAHQKCYRNPTQDSVPDRPINLALSHPPRPHGQTLQPQRRGLDESPKCDDAKNNAENIDNVVSISLRRAHPATGKAAVFVRFQDAGEGPGDKVALQVGRSRRGWRAGCDGEGVDEFEDEVAGEGAAKVTYAERGN